MTDDKTNPDSSLVKRYYRVARREVGYLRFITESYDGLLFVRTLDSRVALVEAAYPLSRRGDAEALLAALVDEIGLVPVPAPAEVPPL